MGILKFYREIIIGFLIGNIFFLNMCLSIKKYSKCTFMSNYWVDIFSFLFSFLLIYYGCCKYDDKLLVLMGVVLFTEHLWQLLFDKLNSRVVVNI